ncbi:MAG TPA: 16S rRNA (uracil(1498)-N(3))-methyltransferase [Acetobacteraceae bacterium]|nr:16S rRNA (uracil(1498)-N(3))-methyltransferase [Acetobacteraceae bacterium]
MQDDPRLFTQAPLAAGLAVSLSPAQAHYLGAVMRRGPGDSVRLFNGRDGEWRARLTALRKDRAAVEVTGRLRAQEPEPDLWLLFAPLKRDATDLVVQKATELGVSALLPVFTERTNAGRMNLERLTAIATEAAEQSERLSVPRLEQPRRLTDTLGDWDPTRLLAAAIERAALPQIGAPAGALLVGPEGGFSQVELDALRARPFVVPVSLGRMVLRAETAAIAGLALLQAQATLDSRT